MSLTQEQKSSIRRHLQYPVVGLLKVSAGGATLGSAAAGYRFFQAYGALEYKMNNLNPDEEARMTGVYLAAAILSGPQPNGGDTVSITLAGGLIPAPVTISAVAPAPVINVDARINLINALSGGVASNNTLQALGIYSAAPYGTGPFSQNAVAIPEMDIASPFAFTLTGTGAGVLRPQITMDGSKQLPPSASLDGTNTIFGYLPILDGLESAYAGTSQNLDTIRAAVWYGRANEAGQRASLYRVWQGKLAEFLGVPLNPNRREDPAMTGAMRFA